VLADIAAAAVALIAVIAVGDDRLTAYALIAPALIVAISTGQRLYDRDELLVNKTTLDQAPQVLRSATLFALLIVLTESIFVVGELGAREVLVLWTTLVLTAIAARRAARFVARKVTVVERCLFVGSDASYKRLSAKLPDGNSRAFIVGRMVLTGGESRLATDGGAIALRRLIDDLDVHRVIIEPDEARPQSTMNLVREANATSVRVSLLPRILEVVGSAIEVDDLDGLTLLGVNRFGLSRSSRLLKRGFDLTVASAGLILSAPLQVLIAILIRLDGPGPVIAGEQRLGRGGEPFEMWRFRTLAGDDAQMTRTGRRLRRLSLDDLPQLVNVLRGEMSLVGPRPLAPGEAEPAAGPGRRGTELAPGMTGQWQIAGTSAMAPGEMMKLDYLYVAGWSLWTDVKILLRTAAHVAARGGQ